ncbi:TatD family hydrolase [Bacteroidales bacterium]|nr:TatD family hydrolase [Bacteroidales bacterium]
MYLIDTHNHLFLEQFDEDRTQVLAEAIEAGVEKIILPNVDLTTLNQLIETWRLNSKMLFVAAGLHPTSVKEGFTNEIDEIFSVVDSQNIPLKAIGEIGIDLYWDKTFLKLQIEAFRYQMEIARERKLPIIIHARDSFSEIFSVLDNFDLNGIKGVFHSFTGGKHEAAQILDYGCFKVGIGGIVTFKNSGLDKTVSNIDPKHIVLETDSPYLAPTPYRGKRNEPKYTLNVAQKLSEIWAMPLEEVARITSENAEKLFDI